MRGIANGTQVTALPTPAAAVGAPGYCNNAAPGPGVTPTNLYPDDVNIILAELLAILSAAGVTPDATGANTGQVLASLKLLLNSGRLLNIQVFTAAGTSTYTPTTGTNSVVVEICGGGGSGGSCAGPNNSAVAGYSGGGSGGSYARGRFTSAFSGVTITVGAGGAAPAVGNNAGNAGGTSSFGALMSAPGGPGGLVGASVTPPVGVGGGSVSSAPSGANIISLIGSPGRYAAIVSTTSGFPAAGGDSFFGRGGEAGGGTGGSAGWGPGAGGSGVLIPGSFTSGVQGGAGNPGIIIVGEYA